MMQHAHQGSWEQMPIEVNNFVDDYVKLAFHGKRAQSPDFDVVIDKQYDPEAGIIELRPQEMSRVILNLMSNAFDAIQNVPDAQIVVRTHRDGDDLNIQIADNGIGMSDKIKDRVFEPFFTTKPPGEGTGLGLSLSYDIVSQGHGGTLAVESEERKGTTFTIRIPAVPVAAVVD